MAVSKKWERMGVIGVDAGCVWIGDPCYVIHKENSDKPKDIGQNWDDFCDRLSEREAETGIAQFNYDAGHRGLGVVVGSGYGDGTYSVMVKRDENNRIMKVMVDFTRSVE